MYACTYAIRLEREHSNGGGKDHKSLPIKMRKKWVICSPVTVEASLQASALSDLLST